MTTLPSTCYATIHRSQRLAGRGYCTSGKWNSCGAFFQPSFTEFSHRLACYKRNDLRWKWKIRRRYITANTSPIKWLHTSASDFHRLIHEVTALQWWKLFILVKGSVGLYLNTSFPALCGLVAMCCYEANATVVRFRSLMYRWPNSVIRDKCSLYW
jgi:hypothetical protein